MSDNLSEDKKQVEALVRDIFQCFVEHRPDDMAARIHEQSTIWDVFVPELLMGVEEKQKYYAADQEQSQARGPLKLTVEPPVIDVWGDVGLARYYLNFDYAPPHPTSGRASWANARWRWERPRTCWSRHSRTHGSFPP